MISFTNKSIERILIHIVCQSLFPMLLADGPIIIDILDLMSHVVVRGADSLLHR